MPGSARKQRPFRIADLIGIPPGCIVVVTGPKDPKVRRLAERMLEECTDPKVLLQFVTWERNTDGYWRGIDAAAIHESFERGTTVFLRLLRGPMSLVEAADIWLEFSEAGWRLRKHPLRKISSAYPETRN